MPTTELFNQGIYWNGSPKIGVSGNNEKIAINHKVVSMISRAMPLTYEPIFKFVVKTEEDIDEVMEKFSYLPKSQIWIMPEGVLIEQNTEILRKLAQRIVKEGICVTPRFQNILFDSAKRAV